MIDNYATILNYVLTLTGLETSDKLELQVKALINEILAYCYRDDIPEEMELPVADVIATELKNRKLIGIEGDVTSYREGDMQVSFGSSATTGTGVKYNGKLDGFKLVRGLRNV